MGKRAALCVVLLSLSPPARASGADDLQAWKRAMSDRPDDAASYEGYALTALAQRRWDEAIGGLQAGLGAVPGFVRGYYLLAVAHRSRQDWLDAAASYRVCIALHQQDNDARYGLGLALLALGDGPAAAEVLRRYVADEVDPAKARYVEQARRDLATLDSDGGGGRHVEAPSLRFEAARQTAAGHHAEAATAWRRFLAYNPAEAAAYNELGAALHELRRYPEAVVALRTATTLDPAHTVAWFNLGRSLRRAGHKAESVHANERFVELSPDDPDGWYALAQAREAAGAEPGAVIDAYQNFIAIEHRADRKKYVEHADKAVAALGGTGARPEPRAAADRDDVLPPGPAISHLRDLRDPFEGGVQYVDSDDLINPFSVGARRSAAGAAGATAIAALGDNESPSAEPAAAQEARVREYASALAGYRQALAAHVDRVSARYDRGVGLLVAGRLREASAAWDGIALDDEQLAAARRSIDRLRRKVRN